MFCCSKPCIHSCSIQFALPRCSFKDSAKDAVQKRYFGGIEMIGNSRSTWCFDKRLPPSGAIHWSESKQHLGDRVSIYGEVKSTFFNWKEYERYIGFPEFDMKIPPTFLEIGETYPSKQLLRAVIWGENRKRFPKPPDELFRDSTVIITGVPYMHNDIVCVQLSAMEDVSIVDPIEGL